MYKIALHAHVFYKNYWRKIEKVIKNIEANKECAVKVLVTVSGKYVDEIVPEIQRSCLDNISLILLPNRGYDIEPFFFMLKNINIDDYDFIIKLHSKNKRWGIDAIFNNRYISRLQWPNFLVDAIAGSKRIFKENIDHFAQDPNLGMIGSSYLITSVRDNCENEVHYLKYFYNKLSMLESFDYYFVSGTMFMVRAELLKPLVTSDIVNENFEESVSRTLGGTKAHALERIFGFLVHEQGKIIKGFDQSLYKNFITSKFMHSIRRFLFDKRITTKGRILIRVFRIPIYNKPYNNK